MKKAKYSAYLFLFVCTLILIGTMGSCSDNNNDNSSSGKVELLSFGPCPIPRGAALRIIGKNLDKVESVVLPGCDAISAADFIKKTATEINVTVPQTADSGRLVLRTGNQEITSIAQFSVFGEIILTGFSPLTAKAGDVIKLEGKDLDFVDEVVFSNDVHVSKDDFVSQSIEAIEVTVPPNAQTGKVAIVIGATSDSPVMAYFTDDLNVVLPTITSFSPETIKGGNEITITGKDFDLVESVSFGGNKTAESFTVNDEKTVITVAVPIDAQDGPVVLTALSGVTVSSATDLIMLVPTITSITPNPVYAGDQVTITGTDLDLINKVTFGGNVAGDVQSGGTATQITVNVPGSAKTGNVAFSTINNKTVTSTDVLTINIKIQYGPETTIWEGNVAIGWSSPVVAIEASNFIGVPANSMLTLYFQQKADTWSQAQICQGGSGWPQFSFAELGGGGTFIPTDLGGWNNLDYTSQGFVLTQDILDEIIGNQSSDGIGIYIQGSDLTFTKATIKEPVVPETIIWEGDTDLGEWGGSIQITDPSKFADAKAGQTLEFTMGAIDMSAGYAQFIVKDSSWANIPGFTVGVSDGDVTKDVAITQALLDIMQSEGIIIQGYHCHITKIVIK